MMSGFNCLRINICLKTAVEEMKSGTPRMAAARNEISLVYSMQWRI